MPKATIQQRLCEALSRDGEREVVSSSRKYRQFTRRLGGFWFVGKSGALRWGSCSSKSFAASDRFKERLLLGIKLTAKFSSENEVYYFYSDGSIATRKKTPYEADYKEAG